MPARMVSARRGLVNAALLAGVLTGCSEAQPDDAKASADASASVKPADAKSAVAKSAVAASGGSVGAAGSACGLPVTFDIAEGWKAEAVDAEAATEKAGGSGIGGELADALLRQGPVTAACEVDAKPAGHIGYLRVWTGDPGADDARAVLEAFVAAEDGASRAKYRTFRTGGLTGAEVEYLYTSELLDETKRERALAVTTSSGPVVLHLGGMDTEEHEAMLPAYELAKRTLRAG